MQIYLARNNQQAGPYTLEQLNQMLASQQVLLTDLAWHEGMTEWRALGELTQGKLVYQPVNSTTNSTFDAPVHSQNDVIRDIKVNQTAKVTAAPVSKRISAKLIDLALLILPQIIVTMLFYRMIYSNKPLVLMLNSKLKLLKRCATTCQHGFQSHYSSTHLACYFYKIILLLVLVNLLVKNYSICKLLMQRPISFLGNFAVFLYAHFYLLSFHS